MKLEGNAVCFIGAGIVWNLALVVITLLLGGE